MHAYDVFYHLKPLIPRRLQLRIRRYVVKRIAKRIHGRWPIDEPTAKPPDNWHGWPHGKQFALVLTHDVENQVGHDSCTQVMQLEAEMGFRSCFNFVPERYDVSHGLLDGLRTSGFEVGVHGLTHDGHLFRSRRVFESRMSRISHYLETWECKGFRAPSMRCNLDWIGELGVEYDSSTFDTDPFEPSPRWGGTIFPFVVESETNHSRYVELPYTLPQDFTLFVILGYDNIDLWKTKVDWIAENGGMVLLNTHPDYMQLGGDANSGEQYPVEYYTGLLEYVKERYDGAYWHALPREVAGFWRTNHGEDIRRSAKVGGRGDRRPARPPSAKIWLDLDNTPHVPFFKPIVARLESRGYETIITARRAFQVCELAQRMRMRHKRIGRHHGKSNLLKGFGLFWRAVRLLPFAMREAPHVALSHGSRAQIIAARLLGIPTVAFSDYEHTTMFRCMRPEWEIMPSVIPLSEADCRPEKVRQYHGMKEDVYVPLFTPTPTILEGLHIREDAIVVTVRPPATEAHYHNPEAEILFEAAMDKVLRDERCRIVLLPRNMNQLAWLRRHWPRWFLDGRVVVPPAVIDGLNMLVHSDLVVSGGGTMNREAAALGIPVYSIFRGRIGGVDRCLSEQGRLTFVETPEDVEDKLQIIRRPNRGTFDTRSQSGVLDEAVAHIESILALCIPDLVPHAG